MRNKGGRSWSIALDTIDPSLGDVSVKASLLDKGALDITFWADRPGTASLMKNMLSERPLSWRYQITTTNTNVIIGEGLGRIHLQTQKDKALSLIWRHRFNT